MGLGPLAFSHLVEGEDYTGSQAWWEVPLQPCDLCLLGRDVMGSKANRSFPCAWIYQQLGVAESHLLPRKELGWHLHWLGLQGQGSVVKGPGLALR